jgi:hypothetical protein
MNRTGSVKFYFDLMFDYTLGDVEVRNMRLIMDEIADDYEQVRATKTPEELVDGLRGCHQELAQRLHDSEDVLDMIPE